MNDLRSSGEEVRLMLTVPGLNISLSGTEVLLLWPATGARFVLETSENLSSGSWAPVAQTAIVENGQRKLTLPAAPGNRFYRLKSP